MFIKEYFSYRQDQEYTLTAFFKLYHEPSVWFQRFCEMLLIHAVALKMLKVLNIAVIHEHFGNEFRQRVEVESSELILVLHDKNGGSRIGESWLMASGILRILDECVNDFEPIISLTAVGRSKLENIVKDVGTNVAKFDDVKRKKCNSRTKDTNETKNIDEKQVLVPMKIDDLHRDVNTELTKSVEDNNAQFVKDQIIETAHKDPEKLSSNIETNYDSKKLQIKDKGKAIAQDFLVKEHSASQCSLNQFHESEASNKKNDTKRSKKRTGKGSTEKKRVYSKARQDGTRQKSFYLASDTKSIIKAVKTIVAKSLKVIIITFLFLCILEIRMRSTYNNNGTDQKLFILHDLPPPQQQQAATKCYNLPLIEKRDKYFGIYVTEKNSRQCPKKRRNQFDKSFPQIAENILRNELIYPYYGKTMPARTENLQLQQKTDHSIPIIYAQLPRISKKATKSDVLNKKQKQKLPKEIDWRMEQKWKQRARCLCELDKENSDEGLIPAKINDFLVFIERPEMDFLKYF